ncbi:hypothetical protein Tsp_04004 [Trichinella spiralis]|uniref:hypothetical protein n=1 Tax=Trichinella spiralis TaxID=6334 RepID=UPI0001EFCCF1|nr:hypothetical protein Tsp_04004 [Trichinella spiralis]
MKHHREWQTSAIADENNFSTGQIFIYKDKSAGYTGCRKQYAECSETHLHNHRQQTRTILSTMELPRIYPLVLSIHYENMTVTLPESLPRSLSVLHFCCRIHWPDACAVWTALL